MHSLQRIIISLEETDQRIDKLLAARFPTHSRSHFHHLISIGQVLVRGAPIKKREAFPMGTIIDVVFTPPPPSTLSPESIPLKIVYEDEHILAIDKPAEFVVHPAPGHQSGTFANALLHYCEDLEAEDPTRPGIVHRLDKDTTGLLLAAKTRLAHQGLVEAFSQRRIKKTYLAICIGSPRSLKISAPLHRHPIKRQERCIDQRGKPAETHFVIQGFSQGFSLVTAFPITGRTHQIRVHLQAVGAPILGDPLYGIVRVNEKYHVTRQLLHAYTLEFIHPITQQAMHLTAPIPEDMQIWIKKMTGEKGLD